MNSETSNRNPETSDKEYQRLYDVYGEDLPTWPEDTEYGALSFHMHMVNVVDMWSEYPVIGNPTAVIDEEAERIGATVIRFESNDEMRRFVDFHRLRNGIIIESFEGYNDGYIQLRNIFPRRMAEIFAKSLADCADELQAAIDKTTERMAESRIELFQTPDPNSSK